MSDRYKRYTSLEFFVYCGKPNNKPSPFIIVSCLIHVMIFGIGCSTLFSMYPIYRNQIE